MTPRPHANIVAALAAIGLALAASLAAAQAYPVREIRSLCNFGAGSGADILVRFYSDRLSKLAGKDTKHFLARTAFDPFPGSPAQMQTLMKSDADRWRRYVELAKIEPQ